MRARRAAAEGPRAASERRVWLVGESNPYQTHPRPEYDLYPHPPQSAGARLCRILGYDPEDARSLSDYLRAFERRNLLYGWVKWTAHAAREEAAKLLAEVLDGDALVLCGAKVAAAFTFPYLFRSYEGVVVRASAGPVCRVNVRALVIPHPSGLSRAWNDPTVAPRVREAVLALREGGRRCDG